jgi:hypothetical protein
VFSHDDENVKFTHSCKIHRNISLHVIMFIPGIRIQARSQDETT